MLKRLSLIALCATLFVLTSLSAFAASALSVGNPAPEFTLNSQEGTPVNLKDYRGKWWSCTSTQGLHQRLHHRGAQLPARPSAV